MNQNRTPEEMLIERLRAHIRDLETGNRIADTLLSKGNEVAALERIRANRMLCNRLSALDYGLRK